MRAFALLLIASIAGCVTDSVSSGGFDRRTEVVKLSSLLSKSSETIVSKQDETLSILHENTTALAAIRDQIEAQNANEITETTVEPSEEVIDDSESTPAVAVKPDTPQVETPAVVLLPQQRQWYLVSEDWCVNCPRAKRLFRSKGWPEDNILTIEKCYERFGFRPKSIPFEFGEPVKAAAAKSSTGCGCSSACTCGCQSGGDCNCGHAVQRTQSSQADLIQLHNRLHGGVSWSWLGDLETHLRTTHGVMSGGEQPVSGSFFQVQGQSAVGSSRSTVRSNSWGSRFVGRSRTSARQSCPSGRCP